jgi:CTP:molybdopterin cytidylyltransferase MocA
MPGHPVLFPARLRPALLRLKGDQGARDILRTEADQILPLPLPGSRAVTDLDTPEDWAAWRALRGG